MPLMLMFCWMNATCTDSFIVSHLELCMSSAVLCCT